MWVRYGLIIVALLFKMESLCFNLNKDETNENGNQTKNHFVFNFRLIKLYFISSVE